MSFPLRWYIINVMLPYLLHEILLVSVTLFEVWKLGSVISLRLYYFCKLMDDNVLFEPSTPYIAIASEHRYFPLRKPQGDVGLLNYIMTSFSSYDSSCIYGLWLEHLWTSMFWNFSKSRNVRGHVEWRCVITCFYWKANTESMSITLVFDLIKLFVQLVTHL